MAVKIDSGEINPTTFLNCIPKEKWPELLWRRRDFVNLHVTYDCRMLVQFLSEAEKMWQPLGYKSRDDLVLRGLQLEPEKVVLAVRWLELNNPKEDIGLPEVLAVATRERTRKAAEKTDGESLPKGRQQSNAQFEHLTQPARATKNRIGRTTQQTLDRLAKKFPSLHKKVIAGELSTHRAAVQAGIVKERTALAVLMAAWKRASEEERLAFVRAFPQIALLREVIDAKAKDSSELSRSLSPVQKAESRGSLSRVCGSWPGTDGECL
jgi:hypothetical protein